MKAMFLSTQALIMAFILSSTAFQQRNVIPAIYTCEGADRSPPLTWSNLPKGTQSLALIVDDPDAPDPQASQMTYVHWVLYNIPVTVQQLPEGVTTGQLPKGTLEGINDWHRTGYGGPCPPIGSHRYFFKLYALDTVLDDLHAPSKAQLETAIQNHILGIAELMGTYQKSKP